MRRDGVILMEQFFTLVIIERIDYDNERWKGMMRNGQHLR